MKIVLKEKVMKLFLDLIEPREALSNDQIGRYQSLMSRGLVHRMNDKRHTYGLTEAGQLIRAAIAHGRLIVAQHSDGYDKIETTTPIIKELLNEEAEKTDQA